MNAIMSNFDIDTGNRPASRNWEGLSELDTRNNRDFGGAMIQFVGAG